MNPAALLRRLGRLGRTLGRNLWHTVAAGPDEPPPALRRVRGPAALLVLIFGFLGALAWQFLSPSFTGGVFFGGYSAWILLAMPMSVAVLLVLMLYRPLLAWRLGWLALLYEVVVGSWNWFGLPFPPLLISELQVLVYLVVLFVVAASQPRGVAFWVWLLTVLLAAAVALTGSFDVRWVLERGVNQLGPFGDAIVTDWGNLGVFTWTFQEVRHAFLAQAVLVGLITVVMLAGQLARYRSRTRRRLAVVEEHGLVLAERARIARELHDVIAHHMSMIAVRAETAPYRLRTVPEAAQDEFQQISHESRTALTEMRRLLGVLRSDEPAPATAPQPGLTDLADLVDAARAAGATVTLEMHGAMTGLPAAVDVSAYRIVQEALTNAARHAAGAPVRIRLRRTGTELSLSVRNQAGAAGPRGATGHGLRGMRERAAALGGELHAGPTEDGGFEVSATLPLAGASQS